jgi:peptide deformylase
VINQCPCCSLKEYEKCCKPFHQGIIPKDALQLMRSRYSAYVLNIPSYIVETTHPASAQYSENKFFWKQNISKFSKNSTFHRLEILDFKERETLAAVTFTAYLSQNDQDATFTERSYFEKMNDQWFYRSGQLAQGYEPNLIKAGQLKLLPLAYYGEAILKKQAEPVAEITTDLLKLIEEMVETMDACNGIGLAAPQVHHSIRLIVMRMPIETEQNTIESGEVQILINPKLSLPSEETWKAAEGCLSIPTIRALVERPKEITVEYTSLDGKTVEKRISGWEARVVMHENDHIEGILFIDRLSQEEQLKLQPHLQNLDKRIHFRKEC